MNDKIWVWGSAILLGLVTLACSSSGGGSPATGGSTGASGSTGSGGSTSDADLCSAQFDATNVGCPLPAASKDPNVQECVVQQRDFAGIGCESQFNAWLQCTTTPAYHCQDDTGCETTQGGYFTCQSQATQRTGCVRLASQDPTRCSDATKPYAFSCLGSAPTSCVQVVTEGAGIWCCPQL
jgi:hypothetical protein